MPRHFVQLETKHAALSTQFGRDWAIKLFGTDAVASLPILKTGKNRGQPKGFVIWRKALTAGYCRECQSPVQVGQLVDAWIGLGPLSLRGTAMTGQWMGRIQVLAGSHSMLFETARERHATEQARCAADWEVEKAEMHEQSGDLAKAADGYSTAAGLYDGLGNPVLAQASRAEAARLAANAPAKSTKDTG